MNPKLSSTPDIVTPNGSIRFTASGIVLESGSSRITVGPGMIEINSPTVVKLNGATVNINNGALEIL